MQGIDVSSGIEFLLLFLRDLQFFCFKSSLKTGNYAFSISFDKTAKPALNCFS